MPGLIAEEQLQAALDRLDRLNARYMVVEDRLYALLRNVSAAQASLGKALGIPVGSRTFEGCVGQAVKALRGSGYPPGSMSYKKPGRLDRYSRETAEEHRKRREQDASPRKCSSRAAAGNELTK